MKARHPSPFFKPGDVVIGVDGLRRGDVGTVLKEDHVADNGIRMYHVDYWGVRDTLTREDFLMRVNNVRPRPTSERK